ncbi:MAG: ribbon-helix-helix protein, CopG family, partial [Poseidonia sp.]
MSQPTSAVSLRITEEDLALLDARVGMDGARNRSDVVRLAIQ